MALHLYTGHIWVRVLEVICSPLQGVEKGKLRIITFSGFDEHTTPLLHVRLLNILKLADHDLVPFLHCFIYIQLSHWSFAMLFWYFLQTGIWSSWLLIIQEVQQNNLITYLNQEQIMAFLNIYFQGPKVWNWLDQNIKTNSFNR